jgi:hypothetical protein
MLTPRHIFLTVRLASRCQRGIETASTKGKNRFLGKITFVARQPAEGGKVGR